MRLSEVLRDFSTYNEESELLIKAADELDRLEKLVDLQRQMIVLIEEHATFSPGIDKEKYLVLHSEIAKMEG